MGRPALISPDEREAVLFFQAVGEFDFYLNGRKIEAQPEDAPTFAGAFAAQGWLSAVRRLAGLRLQAGRNVLLVHTRPRAGAAPWQWYFGAALATVDGQEMPDVTVR